MDEEDNVRRGALAGVGVGGVGELDGQAEVAQLGGNRVHRVVQQHVLRLDVSMDDGRRASVKEAYC